MSTDYVCPFDAATAKKALEELCEDPKNRQGAVDALRLWVEQQAHLRSPTDTRFLLAFLRARKFSQLEARKLLDNYWTRRSQQPKWFQGIDPKEERIQTVLDAGLFFPLPGRDKEGRKVIILRPGAFDPSFTKYKPEDVFRYFACFLDYVYLDEETQVHGVVVLKDFSGYGLKHHSATSVDDRKAFLQTWQSNYPGRVKAIHMYNLGTLGDIILSIAKLAMSTKMQERIHPHGKMLETVYKHIPMEMLPAEYLPDDYSGPNAGSIKQIIDTLKKDMVSGETYELIKKYSGTKYGVDESKRSSEAVPAASFRKLNVD